MGRKNIKKTIDETNFLEEMKESVKVEQEIDYNVDKCEESSKEFDNEIISSEEVKAENTENSNNVETEKENISDITECEEIDNSNSEENTENSNNVETEKENIPDSSECEKIDNSNSEENTETLVKKDLSKKEYRFYSEMMGYMWNGQNF